MSALTVDIRKRLSPGFSLDLAFAAAPAGVTALFGVSGAGKSATLACIAGALDPDAGRIALGDEILFDASRGLDLKMERRGIGWVFQDARLFPHLSVEANLRYGLKRARGRRGVGFDEAVEVLGLGPLLARAPRGLSGGERQRVAIGRALLSQPRLLLMDEPLAALDAPRKAEILPFLEKAVRAFEVPTLYVSHALAEVARLADRLVVLEAGRVVASGPVAEVVAGAGLPLFAGRADAVSVIEAVVEAHDAARGLTRLKAGGAVLAVPRMDKAVGDKARALILARDVMLATVEPKGLSARNQLPARIVSLAASGADAVEVKLRLDGGAALTASLTRDAVSELGLEPGLAVWAVIKSVAVEGAALSVLEG
jgi:molybdate transport system ATP-binding protein